AVGADAHDLDVPAGQLLEASGDVPGLGGGEGAAARAHAEGRGTCWGHGPSLSSLRHSAKMRTSENTSSVRGDVVLTTGQERSGRVVRSISPRFSSPIFPGLSGGIPSPLGGEALRAFLGVAHDRRE